MSSLAQWPAPFVSGPALLVSGPGPFVSGPGLTRPPMTYGGGQSKVVGGRAKAGHDTAGHDTAGYSTNATFSA